MRTATLSSDRFNVGRDAVRFRQRTPSAAELSSSSVVTGVYTGMVDDMKIGNLHAHAIQNISRRWRPSFGYTGQRLSTAPARLRHKEWDTLSVQVDKE